MEGFDALSQECECVEFCTECTHGWEMFEIPPYCAYCGEKLLPNDDGSYTILGGKCPGRVPGQYFTSFN